MNGATAAFHARVAVRIRELRQARGWSQEELAWRSESTQPTVSQWERGIWTPGWGPVKRIAAAFGMTVEELARD